MFDNPGIDRDPFRPGSAQENLAQPTGSFSAPLRSFDLDAASLNEMYYSYDIALLFPRPNPSLY